MFIKLANDYYYLPHAEIDLKTFDPEQFKNKFPITSSPYAYSTYGGWRDVPVARWFVDLFDPKSAWWEKGLSGIVAAGTTYGAVSGAASGGLLGAAAGAVTGTAGPGLALFDTASLWASAPARYHWEIKPHFKAYSEALSNFRNYLASSGADWTYNLRRIAPFALGGLGLILLLSMLGSKSKKENEEAKKTNLTTVTTTSPTTLPTSSVSPVSTVTEKHGQRKKRSYLMIRDGLATETVNPDSDSGDFDSMDKKFEDTDDFLRYLKHGHIKSAAPIAIPLALGTLLIIGLGYGGYQAIRSYYDRKARQLDYKNQIERIQARNALADYLKRQKEQWESWKDTQPKILASVLFGLPAMGIGAALSNPENRATNAILAGLAGAAVPWIAESVFPGFKNNLSKMFENMGWSSSDKKMYVNTSILDPYRPERTVALSFSERFKPQSLGQTSNSIKTSSKSLTSKKNYTIYFVE